MAQIFSAFRKINLLSFIATILSTAFLFPTTSLASQLKMNRQIDAHKMNKESGNLDRVGLLNPGTIVRIPGSGSIVTTNDASQEVVLMKWLSRSGEMREFKDNTGNTQSDYFFPVEVVSSVASDKSAQDLKPGSIIFVPIRFLARTNGINMVIDADPEMALENQSAAKTARQPNAIAPMTPAPSGLTIPFLSKLQTPLQHVSRRTDLTIKNRQGTLALAKRYESSCPGSFVDFQKEILRVSREQRVPLELMLSIMHMESAGRCDDLKKFDPTRHDVGLFQINRDSTPIQRCTTAQIAALNKSKKMKQLRDASLRCLENPVANLEEAAHILRTKYSLVNERKQPEVARWDKSASEAKDDWRKALAAYNGGQSYVYQSYNDILDYNKKHGTLIDPSSWENRRVFFFRRVLDRKTDKQYFSADQKYKRGLKAILINVNYVESISGREARPEESQFALIMQWVRTLYQSAQKPLG